MFNPEGTHNHVPTEVFEKDGQYFTRLNSLTNSTYSVIYYPLTVESVEGYWSEKFVNDMAARLVIVKTEGF